MQRETPMQVSRARDANTLVGNNVDNRASVVSEAMPRVGAEIHFMVAIRNIERLCKLAWPRTEMFYVIDLPAFSHLLDSSSRLHSANQYKSVCIPLHEHIQHPVHPVIQINVGGACLASRDEGARAWTHKRVTRLVIYGVIGFGLDNDTGAIAPDQIRAY